MGGGALQPVSLPAAAFSREGYLEGSGSKRVWGMADSGVWGVAAEALRPLHASSRPGWVHGSLG